jgi:putative phosphoesterase
VLVLADTHTKSSRAAALVERLRPQLERADVILHAGDVTEAGVLEQLAAFAELHAVLGNNDVGKLELPERLTLSVAGCTLAMVHDSGQAAGRDRRLARWFPDADVVVFGHSHLPWHVLADRGDGGRQHQLNPGSATQRRRAPACTVAWVELDASGVHHVRHEQVPSHAVA